MTELPDKASYEVDLPEAGLASDVLSIAWLPEIDVPETEEPETGEAPEAEEPEAEPPETGAADAEQLLARFREWLDEVRTDVESSADEAEEDDGLGLDDVGLVQLVREFTALRHEVKLQTKSARGLEEQTGDAVEALREAGEGLREAGEGFQQAGGALQEAIGELHQIEPKEAEAAQRATAPLVQALVDLDEALQRGQAATAAARRRLETEAQQFAGQLESLYARQPLWRRRLCLAWHEEVADLCQREMVEVPGQILDSLLDGYGLVRGRLQKAIAAEGVQRIPSLDRLVDPHTMTVVDVVDDPSRTPGTVVEEVRPGYLWKGKVLRFAEVRAVRQPQS